MLSYVSDEYLKMQVIQTTTFMCIHKHNSAVTCFCNFFILVLIQACKEETFKFNMTSEEI